MRALATATRVPLVPPVIEELQGRLGAHGAICKTTGAGGGDVIVIASPPGARRNQIERAIIEVGLSPLSLSIDPAGVDFQVDPG
jgi:mevalonate kinase